MTLDVTLCAHRLRHNRTHPDPQCEKEGRGQIVTRLTEAPSLQAPSKVTQCEERQDVADIPLRLVSAIGARSPRTCDRQDSLP